MRPFLVLTWPAADLKGGEAATAASDACRASGWSAALSRPGLRAWIRDERPVPIAWCEARQAAVVGRWFPHGAGNEPGAAGRGGAGPAPAFARARGFCHDGWGSYLALLAEPDGERWWGFRDPSGAVEAFTWTLGPLSVTTSDLAHLPAGFLPRDVSLDWRVIADFLCRPTAQVAGAALQGVHLLAPGDLHPLGEGRNGALPLWRPHHFAPATPEVDPAWPRRIGECVQLVVSTLASPYQRLATELSGGFDSSVVNGALARGGAAPRIAGALHYVGDRREADERAWARVLAVEYGLPLTCIPRDPAAFDPEADFAELARDLRPPFAALDAVRDRDTAQRAVALGAEALVTGKGGDGVFFQMPTVQVLADLWRARGLAALGHPRGAETARWLRRSWWSVWREALNGDVAPLGRPFAFAGPHLAPSSATGAHPWLADLDGIPPGKRIQIEALAGSQAAVGRTRRSLAVDVAQPLMSQPLMELCLSIPSWELVRGGRDRGLAREAFRDWLPATIVKRRSKGALTSIYSRRAAMGLDALRPHLLDGVLADAGLLDRKAMDAALRPDHLLHHNDGSVLLTAAALESWVRHWQTRVPDASQGVRPRW